MAGLTESRVFLEKTPLYPESPAQDLEAKKGGLKTGLWTKARSLPLMLDETIVTAIPPLTGAYGKVGQVIEVPIEGSHTERRVLHAALSIHTGEVLLWITEKWVKETHQEFLKQVRSHWRGWRVILFEDKGSPHTAGDSLRLAEKLRLQLRFLPTATPELNAVDQLWRRVKQEVLANRGGRTVDEAMNALARWILELSPKERLKKAGVLSPSFWLHPPTLRAGKPNPH
jgi:transposase